MAFVSINPATGERLGSYRPPTAKEIEAALAKADVAFRSWRKVAPSKRGRFLRSIARELRKKAPRLAALITREMGKPITQAEAEVEKCAAVCEFYARHGKRWLADEVPVGAPRGTRVRFEPLGVIFAIMPWNFPFWQAFRALAPALMAGNVVVLKHASNVGGCALALEQIVSSARLPKGLFRTLLVSSKEIPALIADRRVRGVTLTGSTEAGKNVGALAGAALKPVVLELGGSDPYLILEDADLDLAAEICAEARLLNSGQSCVCAKRFIVVQSVRKKFEEKFVARLASRLSGDPHDPVTDIGPLARDDLRAELHAQVTSSVKRGARLLLGGKLPAGRGFFYPATVLTDVRRGMPAYDEELFGPVAAIIPVRDERTAIAVANDTIYGLGAAIFTRSARRARTIVPQLEAGMVFVNGYVRSEFSLPFGGTKESGYGRELGNWGLRAWVSPKTVWMR